MRCKLLTPEGNEIDNFDEPGELVVQSHSVVLGYLKNDKANKETFLADLDGYGRWMRTGDEAKFSKAPSGNIHLTITDRIKELIKVKVCKCCPIWDGHQSSVWGNFLTKEPQGLQVAPAELEAHILEHPSVDDVCVIAVPHERSGEVPKAFVVKSRNVGLEENDRMVARDIAKFVEKHKTRHKWLAGGVEFVDVIPKSPSGKILRRLLRDQDRARRREEGAKL
jgi:acyl-CoA synthetase (AMP-forming)/AMP-acid ligase II